MKNCQIIVLYFRFLYQIYNELQPEMKRNLDRWGYSYNEWKNQVNYLKTFTKQRQSYIRSQAKSFFGLSSSKAKELFGWCYE